MAVLPHLRWLLMGLAAVGPLTTLVGAEAAPSGPPARPGFHWSAVTLAESLGQEAGRSAPSATDRTETTAHPDSQPVLEQQAREGKGDALAKEAQNPIANLISLPIQWNATPASQWAPRNIDPSAEANRTLNVWNIQPVVPFRLNDDFLLISRTIVPVIHRPLAGNTDVIGIGDINPSLFVVPRTNSRLQFGFGPTLVIPSATDGQLSRHRWSAGPAAVAVYTSGPLVAGLLANNIWSFAGVGGSRINAMLIQPFINYNLPNGWYLASSPIITSDWTADEGSGWTVPIGAGFGRIFQLGSQPFNASFQAFWNVARPEVVGDRLLGSVTLRLQIQALFPTGG